MAQGGARLGSWQQPSHEAVRGLPRPLHLPPAGHPATTGAQAGTGGSRPWHRPPAKQVPDFREVHACKDHGPRGGATAVRGCVRLGHEAEVGHHLG